jgi:hypothetical protein
MHSGRVRPDAAFGGTAQAILLRSPSGNCDDRALAYEISYQSDGSLGLGGFAAIFRNRPELARPNGDRAR